MECFIWPKGHIFHNQKKKEEKKEKALHMLKLMSKSSEFSICILQLVVYTELSMTVFLALEWLIRSYHTDKFLSFEFHLLYTDEGK